jgi:hypothetical protein
LNWAIVKEPTILATAAAYGLLFWIADMAGLFGLWLGLLVFFSLWRFCYTVLLSVAQGHSRIPPPDIDRRNPLGKWAWFWHWFFFPGLVIAAAFYQPLGSVIIVLAIVVFPASAAVMGATSSLSDAFHPSALIRFARTLGRNYWLLVLGFVAVTVGGAVAIVGLAFVADLSPVLWFFASIATDMVFVWALLSGFALIGSALRAHRLDFDIPGEIKPPEDRARKHQHEDWRRMLDIAYGSFRSGIQVSGYNTLHQLVAANGDSIEVNYWLVENMLEWEDKKYALEVAAKLFPRLVARGDLPAAFELYKRCRRRNPDFRPAAGDAVKIGEFAASIGQIGLAAELGYNREAHRALGTGSKP